MALHILPQGPASFGESLGSGLGSGLAALAQLKLNQVAARQQQNTFSQALQGIGISPEVAQFVAAQNPKNQGLALQNLPALMQLSGGKGQQGGQAQSFGGGQTANALQQASIAQQPTGGGQAAQPATPLQALQGLPKTGADLITNPLTSDAIRNAMSRLQLGEQAGKQVGKLPQDEALQEAFAQALQPQQATPQQGPPVPAAGVAAQQAPTSPATSADILKDIFTSPEEKRRQRLLEIEEKKLALKQEQTAKQEKAERFKATKELRTEVYNKAQNARRELRDLDRMQELDETGKLDDPSYVEFLKRSGLDIPSLLMNPESEEFQKIATGFIREAKQYFGGRITNYDIEQFLKTIPSLSQSPDGRKRVIAGLKQLKRGDLAYNETLREIMKENEGVPPYDLMEQVGDRIEGKLDKIALKFREDLRRPVPKGESGALTGFGAALGSIIGAPGALLNAIGGVGRNLVGGA